MVLEPGDSWQFGILIILLVISMLISTAETAILGLNRIRLRHLDDDRISGVDRLRRATERMETIRDTAQLGILICTSGAVAIAGILGWRLALYWGALGAMVGVGFIALWLNEVTAKLRAIKNPEKQALKNLWLVEALEAIFFPMTRFLTGRVERQIEALELASEYSGEDARNGNSSYDENPIADEEEKLIHNVFEFRESQVKDVMTPRTDMVALSVSSSYEQVLQLFREEQFSRLPIYQETPDDIVGILTIKDLFLHNPNPCNEDFDIYQYMREAYFTYEFKPVGELMKEMQAKHLAIAVVLDEYGGTAGIVTMEDLVEEIVGEIRDEYDQHEQDIEVVRENEFRVEGSTRIDEINELMGTRFESEDFDSIGGYLLGQFGRLPEVGERKTLDGIVFVVEAVDKNRIESVRITILPEVEVSKKSR